MGAHGQAQRRPGLTLTQTRFDSVEMLQLPQDPAGQTGSRFHGLMELPAYVRTAAGQRNSIGPTLGKGTISRVAVALHGAVEVHRDDVLQTNSRPAGSPMIK